MFINFGLSEPMEVLLEQYIGKACVSQKSKADGDTWYCERCGEKLKMVRDSG